MNLSTEISRFFTFQEAVDYLCRIISSNHQHYGLCKFDLMLQVPTTWKCWHCGFVFWTFSSNPALPQCLIGFTLAVGQRMLAGMFLGWCIHASVLLWQKSVVSVRGSSCNIDSLPSIIPIYFCTYMFQHQCIYSHKTTNLAEEIRELLTQLGLPQPSDIRLHSLLVMPSLCVLDFMNACVSSCWTVVCMHNPPSLACGLEIWILRYEF